jgi:hypothetical protein
MAISDEVKARYDAKLKHLRQQYSACDILPGQGTIIALMDYIGLLQQELDQHLQESKDMLELLEKQQNQLAEIRHPYCLSPSATARE